MKTKLLQKKRSQSRPVKVAAKLVKIGNSRGVRLPKALIEQAGLIDDVEIAVSGREIIIRPAKKKNPRAGWEEAMQKAVAEHGNELTEEDRKWLDAPLNTEFDEKEWQW